MSQIQTQLIIMQNNSRAHRSDSSLARLTMGLYRSALVHIPETHAFHGLSLS